MPLHGQLRQEKESKSEDWTPRLWRAFHFAVQILSFCQQTESARHPQRKWASQQEEISFQHLPNISPAYSLFQWRGLPEGEILRMLFQIPRLWGAEREGKQILQQRQIQQVPWVLREGHVPLQVAWVQRKEANHNRTQPARPWNHIPKWAQRWRIDGLKGVPQPFRLKL